MCGMLAVLAGNLLKNARKFPWLWLRPGRRAALGAPRHFRAGCAGQLAFVFRALRPHGLHFTNRR